MTCKWQVEIDDHATKVLEKHWPAVHRERDIKQCGKHNLEPVDVICGGFPCQDISICNQKGKGIDGERSGLWSEYIRVVCEIRPTIVVIENVAALLVRGLDRVLCDLARSGYDAEWETMPASAFGAPHRRDRIFIVAYRPSKRFKTDGFFNRSPSKTASEKSTLRFRDWPGRLESSGSLPDRIRWVPNSEFCRVVDGVPDELHRYKQLGNAVVPQVAEWIGRRVVEALKGGAEVSDLFISRFS